MADSLDKQIADAEVYAQVLYALAAEAGATDRIAAELSQLLRLQEIEPSFRAFLQSRALDDDHREAGLERMFRGKLHDLLLNTLLVMNRRQRNELTEALQHCYVRQQRRASNQVEGRVVSAMALDDAQRTQITSAARELAGGREPLLRFDVDEGLIGGLILQLGDLRFDNSIRRQLRAVDLRLDERGQVGLSIGRE